MMDLEQAYGQVRRKMSEVDALVSMRTGGVITHFFDPISLEMSFGSAEASFLRLTSILYSITHEGNSRLNFDFLTDKFHTQGLDHRIPENFKKICHHLRTRDQHNIDLTKSRDQQIAYACEDWFEKECSSKKPNSEVEWSTCVIALVNEYLIILDKFVEVLGAVLDANDEFSSVVISDWNAKLTNSYPIYRYVDIAVRVANNVGYGWLDLTRFCQKYHKSWLAELAEYNEYEFEQMAQRQIERDLLKSIREKNVPLPFTTDVLIERLEIPSGPKVRAIQKIAEEMNLEKLYTIDELFEKLKEITK